MIPPLAQDNLDDADQHALSEYPYECCGIIIGKPDTSEEDILFRCTNIQNKLHEMDPETYTRDARTAYYIDPKELLGIVKEVEKKKLTIKLFYHSHPDHEAYFSDEDKRMALFDNEPVYPDAGYLVISVRDREIKNKAFFIWKPDNKAFEQAII
jgi:proteasome lid subunit RPN8/RPN11